AAARGAGSGGGNLAVLDPDYPQTALRVLVDGRGDEKSATGNVAVENPDAGPLDEERPPLARAQARFPAAGPRRGGAPAARARAGALLDRLCRGLVRRADRVSARLGHPRRQRQGG